MSQAHSGALEDQRLLSRPTLSGWLQRSRYYLAAYRPKLRDRRFWVIQGLVISIATLHSTFETLGIPHGLRVLFFIPNALYFVPVVYAALNFGLTGAVATALLATALTIPNWVLWHEGWVRVGCIFQMSVVDGMAVFVGRQVERTRAAWQRAQATGIALRVSEMKYRGLFESSPVAILLLDADGTILEANPAAGVLFGRTLDTLKGMTVANLVGKTKAKSLIGSSRKGRRRQTPLVLKLEDGSDIYLEPMLTHVSNSEGEPALQVLLLDVTGEYHQQAGLRAYAAYVLRAQEEERQRIARELHDEAIQQLVLLCRQLDSVGASDKSLSSGGLNGQREARKTAEGVITWLRDFARDFRPSILDDMGVLPSIRRLLADFKERTRLECQLKVVGAERRLSPDRELGIFRIAQEALWNVERHARATRVSVTIAFADHEVNLDVLDNGAGFIVPPVSGDFTAPGQLGLISMQERAKLLSGKLDIQSSLGKGTRVTAVIPI